MTKILVADDEMDLETLIRQRFRQKIREHQYEFVFAVNGQDALEKMRQQSARSIVVVDSEGAPIGVVKRDDLVSRLLEKLATPDK